MTATPALSQSLLPAGHVRSDSSLVRSRVRSVLSLLSLLLLAALLLLVVSRLAGLSGAVSCHHAAVLHSGPSPDSASASPPIVKTPLGFVQGSVISEPAPTPLYLFSGIPFAQPPVGPLRWREPQPPSAWPGVRDCTAYAAVCLQFYGDEVAGSEDCLYLNVWTRNVNASQPVPVMLYIHGGSSLNGDSHAWMANLVADRNVVVVTVAYRLAVMGYLALDLLTANQHNATGRATSGNYGILDNIAALQWVRDNIAAFGGDPSLVTIFGQSTGGTNVMAVLISPLSAGLFQAALSWSGSPVLKGTLKEASAANSVYLNNSNCTAGGDVQAQLACIYALSAEAAHRSGPWDNGAHWSYSSDFDFPSFSEPDAAVIIVDGYVIEEDINTALSHSPQAVQLVYTHMRTEIDGGPPDVRQYNTQDSFAQWLHDHITGQGWNDSTAAAVIAEYPIAEQGNDPQLTYELIVNDVTYCGGVVNMRNAAAASSALTVYHGLNAAHPTPPCSFSGPGGWVTHWSPHGYDMAIFVDTMPSDCNVTAHHLRLQQLMRRLWVDQLAAGHGMDRTLWPVVDSSAHEGGVMLSVVLTQEAALPIVVEDMRHNKCAFWRKLGFGDRGWAN